MSGFSLRRYDASRDEEAAIALWLRSWQMTYPDIDFAGRLDWWRRHWHSLAQVAIIVLAEDKNEIVGFVTLERSTHYLDQIVVAPEYWGEGISGALIAEAKRLSPGGLNLDVNADNARAIAFYEKEDFVITGNGFNAFSGRPVHHMSWRP